MISVVFGAAAIGLLYLSRNKGGDSASSVSVNENSQKEFRSDANRTARIVKPVVKDRASGTRELANRMDPVLGLRYPKAVLDVKTPNLGIELPKSVAVIPRTSGNMSLGPRVNQSPVRVEKPVVKERASGDERFVNRVEPREQQPVKSRLMRGPVRVEKSAVKERASGDERFVSRVGEKEQVRSLSRLMRNPVRVEKPVVKERASGTSGFASRVKETEQIRSSTRYTTLSGRF